MPQPTQVSSQGSMSSSGGGQRRSSSLGRLRNSISNAAQDVAKAGFQAAPSVVRRPSLRNSLSGGSLKTPLALGPPSEDTKWHIGGRYQVAPNGATVWPTADVGNGEPLGEIKPKDIVLMVSVLEPEGALRARGPPMGLVIPPTVESPPGWVQLEDITGGCNSLIRRRLEGSWEMNARYTVMSAATIRRGKALSTDCVGELEQGEEVLALELDFNEGDHGAKPRLRMRVSSEKGLVGWISPETSSGYQLLNPVNLLSSKVVELHRRSLSAGRGRLSLRASFGGGGGDGAAMAPAGSTGGGAVGRESSRGPRASYSEGGLLPWMVGGQYRVLEKVTARDKASLTGKEIGKISPGCLVTFQEVELKGIETGPNCGWVPLALVVVDAGPELGRKGWIRCSANDGHDLVDTRDQLEYMKVREKLEQQEAAQRAAEQQRAAQEAARQREQARRLKEQKLAEEKAQKEAAKRKQEQQAAEAERQRLEAEAQAQREAEEKRLKQRTPSCGACFSFVGSPKNSPKKAGTAADAPKNVDQAKVPLLQGSTPSPNRKEEPEAEDQDEEDDDDDENDEESESAEESGADEDSRNQDHSHHHDDRTKA